MFDHKSCEQAPSRIGCRCTLPMVTRLRGTPRLGTTARIIKLNDLVGLRACGYQCQDNVMEYFRGYLELWRWGQGLQCEVYWRPNVESAGME